MDRLGHRPALDGVRALAIAGVMGLHSDEQLFRGGFYGVDIFFVLSAFLITSLIIEEYDAREGQYSFRSFYSRRALRLGPALLVFLLVLAPVTAFAVGEESRIPIATAASLFYFSDFALAAGIDLGSAYWQVWSLSIEEQFYLLWPWILVSLVLTRRVETQRRILKSSLLGALVLTRVTREAFTSNYFLPTGHMLPIVAGCLAAHFFLRGAPARLRDFVARPWIGPLSVSILVAVMVGYRPGNPNLTSVVLLAVSLSTAVLLLHVCWKPENLTETMLATRPAVWLGRRSYGLYLYHRTLAILIPAVIPGIKLRYAGPLVLSLSFIVAEASFRFIERPINRRGREWLRRKQYPGVRKAEFLLPVTGGHRQ